MATHGFNNGRLKLHNTSTDYWISYDDDTRSFSDYYGSGSPEGVVTADKSSTYRDYDTGEMYTKTTDSLNTGWSRFASDGGDVEGPASSTDNAIARFDGITGKAVQNSGVTISDADIVSGVTQLNVDNLRLDGNTISSTDTNGDINLTPDGSGSVVIDTPAFSNLTGIVTANAGSDATASTVTQHAVLLGGASNAVSEVGPLTNGQLVIGNTGSAPSAAALTATYGTSISNGAGSIGLTAFTPGSIVVDPTAGRGDYQTITAALAAASIGQTIYIRPGTYTENFTLPNFNLSLVGATNARDFEIVEITGKITISNAQFYTLNNLTFSTNSDNAIESTSGASVFINNCYVRSVSGTGISNTSTGPIYIRDTTLITVSNNNISNSGSGTIYCEGCSFRDAGAGTASTASAGGIVLEGCTSQNPFSTTGTGSLVVNASRFTYTGGTVVNHASSGLCDIRTTTFDSGAQIAVTVGTGATASVSNCVIDSAAANVFTGLGTIRYSAVTFEDSAGISTTTALPTAEFKAGVTTITSPSTETDTLHIDGAANSNGANIKLTDSSGTPSKFIRAQGGNFQILNSAYSAALFTMNDVGSITLNNQGAGADPVLSSNSASQILDLTGGLVATVNLNGDHEIKASNSSAGASANSRLNLSTGTANSFALLQLNDNAGSPSLALSLGSAISGFTLPTPTAITNAGAGADPSFSSNDAGQVLDLTGSLDVSGALTLGTTLDETYGGTGQTTYAAGDILYASGANTLAKLAKGSDGEVLKLASGVPSWAASSGVGSWQFISSATASSSSEVVFTSGIDSTYPVYMVVITDLHPETDNTQLYLRTSTNGGVSYDSGAANYSYASDGADAGGGFAPPLSTAATFIALSEAALGTDTAESYNAIIYLNNPSGSTYNKIINGTYSYLDAGGVVTNANFAGSRLATTDIDAIQFTMSSDNIISGTFRLYGLAGS